MASILVIEDNNEIQEILRTLLAEEHEVIQAFSGTEGIMQFDKGGIDLVLLDIMLPGKNGDQVLQAIRQTSQTPVIMLTALGDKKLISQYLLDGANDYVVKPFDLDEVFARVTVQLRQSGEHQSGDRREIDNFVQNFKNIQFDADSFEISNATETIRLAKKECQILQMLLHYPKKIFTKEELYELDPNHEYIETVWGVGVRLKGDK